MKSKYTNHGIHAGCLTVDQQDRVSEASIDFISKQAKNRVTTSVSLP